jgi:hypothetical protein
MGSAQALWILWIPATCLATAILSTRGPRLLPPYPIPLACLAAIAFVLAHATQDKPYASRCLMVSGAAAAGLTVRQLMPDVLPSAWTTAIVLASVGVTAAVLAGRASSRIPPETFFALPPSSANQLLRLGWLCTGAYALGWAAQLLREFPLRVRAALAALGITLFLGLAALLAVRLTRAGRTTSLPAEMGLYFCWLNLSLLLFWGANQASMAPTVS